MIRLFLFAVVLFAIWLFIRKLTRQATFEDARTIGLQIAGEHIQNPILYEDYLQATRIPEEQLDAMIEREDIPSYRWRQYTFVENRELIKARR